MQMISVALGLVAFSRMALHGYPITLAMCELIAEE